MSELTSFEAELESHGSFIYKNVGKSMMPMIRENRDVIIISRKSGRLKKYDVALYRKGEKYILHRILRVSENDYVIAGDHCTFREYGITDSDIIGVLTGIIRDGKEMSLDSFSYKLYYHLWCDFYFVRVAFLRAKQLFHSAARRIVNLFSKK